ncbi:ubiquitin-conjugating enzyme E2 H [Marasmius tenuissimus]|nr:ubiquitin-conjugating enzyme E2 H [Marasmius tenuissimus]
MPLFRENPVRSTAAVIGSLALAHMLTMLLSSSSIAFHLTQTTVAILAIAALMVLVSMHHRREGHILTQTQEEMVLIGGFGLFWLAVILGWRAFSQGGRTGGRLDSGVGHATSVSQASQRGRGPEGNAGGRFPYPCSRDDIYCVVEEYSYY